MKTVLITGCSTGFGHAITTHFLDRGWNVVATMRDPSANTLPPSDRLRVLALDVTDADSIASAVAQAGAIDVLVNNAGIGWLNAIEGTPLDTVRHLFETNTFSVIAMMQAVLPGMRARGGGTIVNVSSSVTIAPLPLLSVYRASKAAVNALSEAAALELADFGIRVRVVLPGYARTTSFADSARSWIMEQGGFPDVYADFAERTVAAMQQTQQGDVTTVEDAAAAAFRGATDPDSPMIQPAGADAVAAFAKRG